MLYTADGITNVFPVPFEYLDKSHIVATVNQEVATFSWLTNNTIQLDVTPTNGALIKIMRITPRDSKLVDFKDSAMLTGEELNKAIDQVFYTQQELDETVIASFTEYGEIIESKVIEASAHAINAKASELAAKASKDNALVSETNAKASELAAKTSEDNALVSETNAKASELAAKASEDNALIYANSVNPELLQHKSEKDQPGGYAGLDANGKIDSEWIKDASETAKGVVELATPAEVLAGTDTERAVTPAGFKAAFGEFYPTGVTPTYVDSTHFTVAGDLTAIFTKGRVLKITDTGGTFNAICATSTYNSGTELTTVTVAGDTIDSGISAVLYAVQQVTGAIWESGSNINGNYVKFADGTLICRREKIITGAWETGLTLTRNWTFPAEMINTTFMPLYQKAASANSVDHVLATRFTTDISFTVTNNTGTDIGLGKSEIFLAIGRWY